MLVGIPPEEGLKISSARERGDNCRYGSCIWEKGCICGIKGNWDTLSILMKEKAEFMGIDTVGLENLLKRRRLLLFSH